MDPDYDVKIVGGKRRVIWRFNSPNTQSRTSGRRSVLPPIPTSGAPYDEIHVRRQLKTFLREYSESQLISLNADLQERPTLSPEIFTAIAARHRLPIPDNLLKSLCERFATNFTPVSVQSDKLIDYLIQCKQLGDQVLNFENRSMTSSSLLTPRAFPEHDEARLVWDLEREFVGDNSKLDNFRRHAYELDNLRRGVLSRQQIEVLLNQSNISLTPEFLTRLLRHCDHQGYGLYSVSDFLSFLERATVENQILFTPSERKIIRAKTPKIPLGPLPHHRISNYALNPRVETPLGREDWLIKFNKMGSALLNTPQEIPGYLSRNYVINLTDTYNVVYNLQLNSSQIEDAINNTSENGQVEINSYIIYLKSAHLVRYYT